MYEDVFRLFNRNKIKYVVIGGMAVNLQGAMRSTADLDIAAELTNSNLDKIFKTCVKLGYTLRQPIELNDVSDPIKRRKLIRNKHLKAVTFHKQGDYKEIDVLIDLIIPFKKLYSNADMCKVGNLKIRLACINDLIRMKSATGRPLDKIDTRILKQVKGIRKKRAR